MVLQRKKSPKFGEFKRDRNLNIPKEQRWKETKHQQPTLYTHLWTVSDDCSFCNSKTRLKPIQVVQ